jgi:hypothetical protein
MPPGDSWKGYVNRKSWASLVFQWVVDGDGNFRNVSTIGIDDSHCCSGHKADDHLHWQVSGGAPGSMHDSRLFRISQIGHSLTVGAAATNQIIPEDSYLIGNAGYPANVGVLVPYPSIATPENEDFNFIHSSTCMVVEQAFGRLKNRFRILLSAQKASPVRARNNTFACMILHNILNRRGSLYLQVWDDQTPGEIMYNEVPDADLPGNRGNANPDTRGQHTMSARRDQIRDELCS